MFTFLTSSPFLCSSGSTGNGLLPFFWTNQTSSNLKICVCRSFALTHVANTTSYVICPCPLWRNEPLPVTPFHHPLIVSLVVRITMCYALSVYSFNVFVSTKAEFFSVLFNITSPEANQTINKSVQIMINCHHHHRYWCLQNPHVLSTHLCSRHHANLCAFLFPNLKNL